MYTSGAWLHLLCRFPLLTVPVVISFLIILPHLTNAPPLVPEAMVTVTHPNLIELNDDQIIAELRDSRAFLERSELNERALATVLCHLASWPTGH